MIITTNSEGQMETEPAMKLALPLGNKEKATTTPTKRITINSHREKVPCIKKKKVVSKDLAGAGPKNQHKKTNSCKSAGDRLSFISKGLSPIKKTLIVQINAQNRGDNEEETSEVYQSQTTAEQP